MARMSSEGKRLVDAGTWIRIRIGWWLAIRTGVRTRLLNGIRQGQGKAKRGIGTVGGVGGVQDDADVFSVGGGDEGSFGIAGDSACGTGGGYDDGGCSSGVDVGMEMTVLMELLMRRLVVVPMLVLMNVLMSAFFGGATSD